MGGSRKLEVRGETFNLLNHATNEFIEWDPAMYMGFLWDTGAADKGNSAAGTATQKTGHREISLAAKFYF
jgi:hypothetical protein